MKSNYKKSKISTSLQNPLQILYLIALIILSQPSAFSQQNQHIYQYEETIDLIAFVEAAANEFHLKGEDAYIEFGTENSKWLDGERYLFIFDLDGNCVFHPVEKELVDKNWLNIKDMNGKPLNKYIIDIASIPNHPNGWVHYLAAERGMIFPEWKTVYVTRVLAPDGKAYAICSGTNSIRTEKKFMTDIVDSAANLINVKGEDAFNTLLDKSSIFYFNDIYLFVLSMDGKTLADPAFPLLKGRDIINFQDVVGKFAIRELIDKLKVSDSAFLVYLWPKPGHSNPSKRLMYARKANANGLPVIVGSAMFVTEPIWKIF
nr:cache domain-containing protein [Bacteroidota bacterium]